MILECWNLDVSRIAAFSRLELVILKGKYTNEERNHYFIRVSLNDTCDPKPGSNPSTD
jgi:hypothetical protein